MRCSLCVGVCRLVFVAVFVVFIVCCSFVVVVLFVVKRVCRLLFVACGLLFDGCCLVVVVC